MVKTEFRIDIDDEILVQQFEDEWQDFVDDDVLEQVADRSKLGVPLGRGICTFLTQDDFPGAGHLNRKTDLSSNPPLPPPPTSSLTLIGALPICLFTQERDFNFARAEYYLQAVICRSCSGLSENDIE